MAKIIEIQFGARETLPMELSRQAHLRGLTDAEYAKRLIAEGLERLDVGNARPAEPGKTLEDFLVRNGALYPKE
jgi:hypothetical protein